MKKPLIKLENVRFAYSNAISFCFDLEFHSLETVAITGTNGSGKTTLLQIISGFAQPSLGSVYIRDQIANTLAPNQRGVSVLFSKHNLFNHLSIYDNLTLAINPKGRRLKKEDKAHIDTLLEMLQIEPLKWKKPVELSDGQRQKAGIARCLSQKQSIILMDEPFSAIDVETRRELMKKIIEFGKQQQATILFVTHNLYEIKDLVKKVLILDEGKVRYYGATEGLEQENKRDLLHFSQEPLK